MTCLTGAGALTSLSCIGLEVAWKRVASGSVELPEVMSLVAGETIISQAGLAIKGTTLACHG